MVGPWKKGFGAELSWSGLCVGVLAVLLVVPKPVYAMHISEGILPFPHALFWTVVGLGFLFWSVKRMSAQTAGNPMMKPFIGMVGAGVFLISAMPIPVPTAGTCSHPAGTGIAAILIGPFATVVVASISLLLQALFMAHGGLSTLGADIFAMGVLGGFAGYGAYKLCRSVGVNRGIAAFAAGLAGDWATYVGTSVILTTSLGDPQHGYTTLFLTVLLAFVPTQIPLGILEGVMASSVVYFLHRRRPELLRRVTKVAVCLLIGVLLVATVPTLSLAEEGNNGEAWPGVDVTVVEKTAQEQGREPAGPLIPVEGDLLLFAFLLAGLVGGFVLGYYYHALMVQPPPERSQAPNRPHATPPD